MHRRPHQSIDGFGLRRRNTSRSVGIPRAVVSDTLPIPQQFLKRDAPRLDAPAAERPIAQHDPLQVATPRIVRSDIDESLQAIDNETPTKKPRRRIRKKAIKRAFLILLLCGVVGAGYFGFKIVFAGTSIFQGNIFSIFTNKELQKDTLGRSNILIFGTSEDDPSHINGNSGTELTDSMMVISIDQAKKNAVMFSIPRDLWVDYGQACAAGYQGKINAMYECAKDGSSVEAGANRLKALVGDVFGMDIQYYAKVNYGALRDAVNAVGGITVTIESDDSRGVMDDNFDWMCGRTRSDRINNCPPRGHLVDFPNGPANLDGEHALALARARNASGGYGLSGGNFDREQYQQKIIVAIRDKAVSAGTLANPAAVSQLIDSLGNNIKTNFETSEIKTLVELASGVKKENIKSLSLIDGEDPLVTTGNYSGQSIVRPIAGLKDYSDIKQYISSQLANTGSGEEASTIAVLNGSDGYGFATRKKDELALKGIVVTSIGDAPVSDSYGKIQWFDLTGGTKPQMAKRLTDALGEGSSGTKLPEGVNSDANFVIILGNGAY